MPSFIVDGMKPESVHEAIKEASDRARRGDGPTLLDIRTYRYKGHSMSDPQKYRTKKEVESYKAKDPITRVLDTIKKNKLSSDSDLEKINIRVKLLIEESIKFAEDSPFPEPEAMYEDIYAEPDYPFIKD